MKTIGLIGGMSWESTALYYRVINEAVNERLGGLHSARVLMYSVDFQPIERMNVREDWDGIAEVLSEVAATLESAGADLVLLCTNTMHRVAGQIQAAIGVPLLHIADPTIARLQEQGISKAALLGTKYTMQQDFYKARLLAAGIEALVPQDEDIELVNDVIYSELCKGIISEESRREYLRVIAGLEQGGAQGVILGCTEIGLLISPQDSPLPTFDTAIIHATEAAIMALS